MQQEYNGLIAAVHTPMNEDGTVNLGRVPEQTDFLVNDGISSFFVCGTAGEFVSLTMEERMQVSEAFMDAVGGRVPIIVHVGHNCLLDACRLARHAAEIGATAVAVSSPFFFKPADIDALIEWCRQIAESIPDTPLFYYHIPSLTGVALSMLDFLAKAERSLPMLAGIKYAAVSLAEYSVCVHTFGDRFSMMFGMDDMLVSALATGMKAAVGAHIINWLLISRSCGKRLTTVIWRPQGCFSSR